MGETRRLGRESWRRLTTGARYGKSKLGALEGRGGAQLTGGAGEGRGSHPALAGRNRTARCTTTPGGAERDPHPRPSSPGSVPTSSSSAAQVRPGRNRAGWGCRAPLLSLPPPAATRVAMATARVPAPHRGGVKSPALCKFRAGWAGMRGPGRLGARARLSRLLPAWPGRRAGGGRPGGRGGKERSGPGRRGFVSFVRGGGSAAAGGAGSGRSFPPLGLRVTAAAPSDPPPGVGGFGQRSRRAQIPEPGAAGARLGALVPRGPAGW